MFCLITEIRKTTQLTPSVPPSMISHIIAIAVGVAAFAILVIAFLLNIAYRKRKFPFKRRTKNGLENAVVKESHINEGIEKNNPDMVRNSVVLFLIYHIVYRANDQDPQR